MHRSGHVKAHLRQSHYCILYIYICKACWRDVVEFRCSRRGLAGDPGRSMHSRQLWMGKEHGKERRGEEREGKGREGKER